MNVAKNNFQIVRLATGDARYLTDHLYNFKDLVLSSEAMYPEIELWFRHKVLPGLRSNERVGFVGYLDEKPVVSAVLKKGSSAKFCHLRVNREVQDTHLGELFFSLMTLELRDVAEQIHFTLPESLWRRKSPFFESFGFTTATIAEVQYRLFDQELRCTASYDSVWDAALSKLPKLSKCFRSGGFSSDNPLVMSVKPDRAEQIMAGSKTVELRKRFSKQWEGEKINVYATAPLMSLVGEAKIHSIIVDDPQEIWRKYGDEIGCSRLEFDEYVSDANVMYAIELNEIRPYRSAIPLTQLSRLIKEELVPPQSYFTLEKNKAWAKAVSVASYLHGFVRSNMILQATRHLLSRRTRLRPGRAVEQSEFDLD
jgi:predicted transcriptional regulator